MTVYLDQSVSGDQVWNLSGGNQVLFLACDLGPLPDYVSHPDSTASDHVLRAGWLSLGDTLVLPGSTAFEYWRVPIQVNFVHFFWTPIPTGVGATAATCIASLVRVHMAPGVSARLYVFGV